jgi:hypothetical protein
MKKDYKMINKFKYFLLIIILTIFINSNSFAWDNLENKELICKSSIEKRTVWGLKFLDELNIKMYQVSEFFTKGNVHTFAMYYEAKSDKIFVGESKFTPSFGHMFSIDRKTLIISDHREYESTSDSQCFFPDNFDKELTTTYDDLIKEVMKDNKI